MKTYHIFKKTLPLIFIATLFLFTSCQISNDEISNNETEINKQNTTTINNIVSEDSTENTSIEEDDIVKFHSPKDRGRFYVLWCLGIVLNPCY